MKNKKRTYISDNGSAEGNAQMRGLLGGKGANLAEMNRIDVLVPPGFTTSTEVCTEYYERGREAVVADLKDDLMAAVEHIETIMGSKFGDVENPPLVSVCPSSRALMPGMMDTILNLGFNDTAVDGSARKSSNGHFAWDSYRRFVQMYGDVVFGMKSANRDDIDPSEAIIKEVKKEAGVKLDNEPITDHLKDLVKRFKAAVTKVMGHDLPTDPYEQLWGAVMAVLGSWMNNRAILYRKMEGIPDDWGTAVNVQTMVFSNMGDTSATGVAFTRDVATGKNLLNGEYLVNARGEDIVASIRTPQEITIEDSRRWAERAGIDEATRKAQHPSMEETFPNIYAELNVIQHKLEEHYHGMQDLGFTVQEGKLQLLQTRNGKRMGQAMVKIATDLFCGKQIPEEEALLRVEPAKLDELLHPVFDKKALQSAKILSKGLPASPGAATGQIVFFADDAASWHEQGKNVIMVRIKTLSEDLADMSVAQGTPTARGSMVSYIVAVARDMGKCCTTDAGGPIVDHKARIVTTGDKVLREGDLISISGPTGEIYRGQVGTKAAETDADFHQFMELADKHSKLVVRTNADTSRDVATARAFGVVGIGLCHTEHMFPEDNKIKAMREMILVTDTEGCRKALTKLLPIQTEDFKDIFRAMKGPPVTARLLDPPLHEFIPQTESGRVELAKAMGVEPKVVHDRIERFHELNSILGHRGCRLGNAYPEITEMQTRATLGACPELKKEGIETHPEIMIPLVDVAEEFKQQTCVIHETAEALFKEQGDRTDLLVEIMIEVLRVALTVDEIGKEADFFSFGTNDLTQMTFGYSHDGVNTFLPTYLNKKISKVNPFQQLNQRGVDQLVQMGAEKGRLVKSTTRLGICGEHGGDPSSVEFCYHAGPNYVSCSLFRVPIARLAAARAAVEDKKQIAQASPLTKLYI